MANLRKNKKGTITDVVFIIVVLVVFSIGILISFKVAAEINTKLQESDIPTADGQRAFQRIANLYPGVIDGSFLFLAFGLAIAAFVFASLIRVHPVFLALFILTLIIVIFVAGVFSNIYQTIAEEPEFITYANQLKFTSIVINTLPFIIAIFGGMLAIVMYKTFRSAEF